MKQHLFYTFLSIFVLTAVITLLGITDVIKIREQYLTPLFGSLLIELVGAVLALYRGAKFFDDHIEREPPIAIPTKNKQVAVKPNTQISKPTASNSTRVVPEQKLDDYFQQLSKLEGRFHESEQLRKETHGKIINFRGVVRSVHDSRGLPQIMLQSPNPNTPLTVFVDVLKEQEKAAYSLRQGDVLQVSGVADTTLRSSVGISEAKFIRVEADLDRI